MQAVGRVAHLTGEAVPTTRGHIRVRCVLVSVHVLMGKEERKIACEEELDLDNDSNNL